MVRRFRDPVAALEYMLDVAERHPTQERVLAYPDYAGMNNEEERETFHRVISSAEDDHAVTIKRDRHAGPADIRFVALADVECLTRFLRRTSAVDAAEQAIYNLRHEAGTLPEWVENILSEIASAWSIRREPYPGLVPGDVLTALKFLRILAAIDLGEHLHGWDMRTFSSRACGDSKAVESGMARLARAIRLKFELPETMPREVLAAIGIEKYPQAILMHGFIQLPQGPKIIARPYIGIPSDWATDFIPLGDISYVLIIENLASFNRYTRLIDDSGFILFSAGFPSRATLKTIQHLDSYLSPEVPFYHWGDTDHHGYLILKHIDAAISRSLQPHLMDIDKIEQEEIDPVAPSPKKFTDNQSKP